MKHTKNNILLVIKARYENTSKCLEDLRRRGLKDSDLYKSLLEQQITLGGIVALFEDKQYFHDVANIFRDIIDLEKID